MAAFAKFQHEKNVPLEDQFSAYVKCYAVVCDDDSTEQYSNIMEDLRAKKFQMCNKSWPARVDQLHMVIHEIGKFHMKDQRPTEFAEFQQLNVILARFFESQNIQAIFIEMQPLILQLKCCKNRTIKILCIR